MFKIYQVLGNLQKDTNKKYRCRVCNNKYYYYLLQILVIEGEIDGVYCYECLDNRLHEIESYMAYYGE